MRSLELLTFCLTTCNAVAVNYSRHATDVTIGPPLQTSPTRLLVGLPAEAFSNPTSSISDSLSPLTPSTASLSLIMNANSTPPELPTSTEFSLQPTPPALDPATICSNITANLNLANYTQPYTCTLKPGTDYAILGMYYDTCSLLMLSSPSTPPSPSASNPMTASSMTPMLVSPRNGATLSSPPLPSLSSPAVSNTGPTDIDTLFCCDPTYSQPLAFETLCVWGEGIDIANLLTGFDPRNVTRPSGKAGIGRCTVRPLVRPGARCVQVGSEGS